MANFLPKEDEENTEKLELVDGQLVKKINARKIMNKDDWTTAFIRYMSVYLDKNPRKNIALLRYLDNVRLAADKFGGLGWRAYDEQFRLSVSDNPEKYWAPINNHLLLIENRSSNKGKGRAPKSDDNSETKNTFKGRFCRYFNYGTCSKQDCIFPHVCKKCGSNHTVTIKLLDARGGHISVHQN